MSPDTTAEPCTTQSQNVVQQLHKPGLIHSASKKRKNHKHKSKHSHAIKINTWIPKVSRQVPAVLAVDGWHWIQHGMKLTHSQLCPAGKPWVSQDLCCMGLQRPSPLP